MRPRGDTTSVPAGRIEASAPADAQQRDAELPVVDAGVPRLGSRAGVCAPGTPEGAEGGEAAQHAHPPDHDRARYPPRDGGRRALTSGRGVVQTPRDGMAPSTTSSSFDGIPGESLDDKHKGEIEVLSWSWGEVAERGRPAAAAAAGAGKVDDDRT